MHVFDLTILIGALSAFLLFFILQMIIFRIAHPEAVLKVIMMIFFITSALQLLGFFIFLSFSGMFSGALNIITILGASYLIFGLMAFVYILCVFGPSETSIRIRVIRELIDGPNHSLTPSELSNRYNGKMVLERRMERLTRSGEIVLRDGKYFLIRKTNVFFFIDVIANAMQAFIKNR